MNLCREKTRRTKTQFDLNLAIAIKDNKNCFYKYIKKQKEDLRISPSFIGCGET